MALVKVGAMALRSPSGDFLPEEPIYRDIPEKEPESEYIPLDELSGIFAEKFAAYQRERKKSIRNERKKTT